ncbi:TetR/AcrR family transcriptional regulator [Paractinoplanes atraurantiacus]|uniref:Regulatory protein, tetR family n=1 Tax=Paractinoplanes atraurantiacus TaxID=1036182 RepID=A0A285KDH1_9ACTN|nr:TetR/AcrR family transcriptional regulator C-terminal domain-containing protein [Actinoplanes atraurantiacus]SNY70650.1 regulatory protein, tetR family [Actinoplanes atraurantiacus]
MALTPAVIAQATLALGDREGASAMSMRRIAATLACDPMAIYRHYPNRRALLDAVADSAVEEVAVPAESEPWDQRIRAVLTGVREAALRHPGVAEHIASRPPLGPAGRRLAAAIMAALAEAGLGPADVVKASQALIAYSAAGLRMAVEAGAPDDRWHQVNEALRGETPVVGSAEQFDYGLRLLLDGIRATAARS